MKYERFEKYRQTGQKVAVVGMVMASMLCFAPSGNAAEAGLTYSLAAPQRAPVAGTQQTLELIVINRLPQATRLSLAPTLDGTIMAGPDRWPVRLTVMGDTPNPTIPAGGFALIPLAYQLPEGISGRVEITVHEPAPLRAILDIPDSANVVETQPASPPHQPRASASGASESPLAIDHLTRFYSKRFGLYEPMYFLYGFGDPSAKFQLSFKYLLIGEDTWIAQHVPVMENLNIAYTQRTLWDIDGSSSPFYDTSYLPELGFQFFAPEPKQKGSMTWLGWQTAIQHESNGRGGLDSRGLNTLFVRAAFTVGDLDGWHLTVAPRLFTYLSTSGYNDDIADYRGYSEIRLLLAQHEGLALSVTGGLGEDFDHGYAQIDLTIPSRYLSKNGTAFLHLQYWTGYGENLLDYNINSDAVRFGFSLVR